MKTLSEIIQSIVHLNLQATALGFVNMSNRENCGTKNEHVRSSQASSVRNGKQVDV
jgi:hypothetical protein